MGGVRDNLGGACLFRPPTPLSGKDIQQNTADKIYNFYQVYNLLILGRGLRGGM